MQLIEDFLNTLDERTYSRHGLPHATGDLLSSAVDLSVWFSEHGLGDTPRAEVFDAELAHALDLRSALRRTLALRATHEPRSDTLQTVNAAYAALPLQLKAHDDGSLGLTVIESGRNSALDRLVETVARSVGQGTWRRLKMCAAPDCRWVFYDESRSGAGRWCSMAVCGNRYKTRRYRHRNAPTVEA